VIGIAPAHFRGLLSGLEPNAVWIPTATFGVGYRYCDGLSRACAMVAAGIAACVIAGPFLAHLLYGVSPRDPLAIVAGPAVLIVVAALAVSLPARRAMRQDPIAALRAE
jgi:ABC-type lipoprotein release transport system permease subunit